MADRPTADRLLTQADDVLDRLRTPALQGAALHGSAAADVGLVS